MITPSQRARDAAAGYIGRYQEQPLYAKMVEAGQRDNNPLVQAFAKFEQDHLAEQGDVARLREALADILPAKLCGEGWDLPDSETVSIVVTFGKLKAARAALSTPADEWRPIADAPRDGTRVDLRCDGIRFFGCWWQDANPAFPIRPVGWTCSRSTGRPFALAEIFAVPTHFSPLPSPPKESRDGE